METKNCWKYFNSLLNVVSFCRNINIGKITAGKKKQKQKQKKHKWFVDVETGRLSDTLEFVGLILLHRENPVLLGVVRWKQGKSLNFAFKM